MWTEAHIHKGLKTELARVSPVKHLKVSKAKKTIQAMDVELLIKLDVIPDGAQHKQ